MLTWNRSFSQGCWQSLVNSWSTKNCKGWEPCNLFKRSSWSTKNCRKCSHRHHLRNACSRTQSHRRSEEVVTVFPAPLSPNAASSSSLQKKHQLHPLKLLRLGRDGAWPKHVSKGSHCIRKTTYLWRKTSGSTRKISFRRGRGSMGLGRRLARRSLNCSTLR